MGLDDRPKRGFQQKNRTNKTALSSTLKQRNKENIITTDACKTGLGVTLWQKQGNNKLKPIAFASRYLNAAKKKRFHKRTRTICGSLEFCKILIPPIR